MIKQLGCLLFLASSKGLIPATKNLRTNTLISSFNSHPSPITAESNDEGTDNEDANSNNSDSTSTTRSCFWRPKGAWWKERILLEDLKVGQALSGHLVQENLLAKTGPKLYFECGIGRTNRNGDWSIVNGMLRLDRGKTSVTKKRAARFRKKDQVQLFVSRVQKECGRLEVCAKIEDVEKYAGKPKVSVTSLKKDQEVIGKVIKLHPYGAIVDIGANVRGLLHITKVARVMGRYIDGEKGLKDSGLEKGATVRLIIESIEKRRISLDFTDDVKKIEREEKTEKDSNIEGEMVDANEYSQDDDELAAWAAYSDQEARTEKEEDGNPLTTITDDNEYDDEYDDEYDEEGYDEEMDIESSLGLDMY